MAPLAVPGTADAQLFKKLKKELEKHKDEAKELLDEAIKCVATDMACINRAQQDGKEVVLTEEDGTVMKDEQGNPVKASDRKNAYAGNTTVDRLGTLSDREPQYAFSPDGRHVALVTLQGSRQVVKVDGKADPVFDQVLFNTFVFSYSGNRYAYVARRGGQCVVVVDGKESDTISCGQKNVKFATLPKQRERYGDVFQFSSSGKTLVYYKEIDQNSYSVIINNSTGPVLSSSYSGYKIYIRGEKVFYIDYSSAKLYINNQPTPDRVKMVGLSGRPLRISNDGKNYAYITMNNIAWENNSRVVGAKEWVVKNGEAGPKYSTVNHLEMDEHTGTVFYEATLNETWAPDPNNPDYKQPVRVFVIGDTSYKFSEAGAVQPLDVSTSVEMDNRSSYMTRRSHVVMSPDGSRRAFVTAPLNTGGLGMSEMSSVTVRHDDGKQSYHYQEIGSIAFTSDSKTLLFTAVNGGKKFVVVNEKEIGPFDKVSRPIVGKSGGNYAFVAGSNQSLHFYLNGEPVGPELRAIDINRYINKRSFNMAFPDDLSHYAYSAELSVGDNAVVVDDEVFQQQTYQFMAPGSPPGSKNNYVSDSFIFSADGTRLAYLIRTATSEKAVMLDGKQLTPGMKGTFTYPKFSPDGKHFVFLHGEQRKDRKRHWQLFIDGKPGPEVANSIPDNPNAVGFTDNKEVYVMGFLGNEVVRNTVKIQ